MRLAIVTGICVERDAISAAVDAQAELALSVDGVTAVDVFVGHLGRQLPCPAHEVRDPWALLTHEVFARADVAVFHFGIRYSLFDALAGLDTLRTRPVVHYHNVTPIELVPPEERATIERSHRQLAGALSADPDFWYFSEFNRRALLSCGVDPGRLRFVPFPIEPPRPVRPRADPNVLSLVCVGRLVPSKGTDVVLEAVARARRATTRPVRLTLVGNPVFSDPDYIAQLDAILDREDLRDIVTILADVDDDELWRCYEEADVVVSASYHEGLCVPVIEGYLAGCRVIGTTAGNLPFIVQPPDVVVEPGDVDALARAIVSVDRELASPHHPRYDAARELCLRYGRDASRKAMELALRDRVTASGALR